MQEIARLIFGLRAAGWSEKEINDFLLFIESGEEQYKPKAGNITKKQLLYILGCGNMPSNAEMIEKPAGQLEQQKFLIKLRSCGSLEDFRS